MCPSVPSLVKGEFGASCARQVGLCRVLTVTATWVSNDAPVVTSPVSALLLSHRGREQPSLKPTRSPPRPWQWLGRRMLLSVGCRVIGLCRRSSMLSHPHCLSLSDTQGISGPGGKLELMRLRTLKSLSLPHVKPRDSLWRQGTEYIPSFRRQIRC